MKEISNTLFHRGVRDVYYHIKISDKLVYTQINNKICSILGGRQSSDRSKFLSIAAQGVETILANKVSIYDIRTWTRLFRRFFKR